MNLCRGCDNVAEQANHPNSRIHSKRWRCLRYPTEETNWPVTDQVEDPPYRTCTYVRKIILRDEDCLAFVQLRKPGDKNVERTSPE